ncbi:extracellular solute-binding protein [Paenibacillus sp. LHD-38]|nr:extracellular solute-binding protein [Paenibacillus sp. LHD-38]MDQ8737277.1 extracellular solute-binding protein [Paenibacillus sp. LHD-38]
MRRNRWRCCMLLITILLLAGGCARAGDDNNNVKTLKNEKKGSQSAAISILANLHTSTVPPDRIERMLEEKTGTMLDIQWVPDGSYEEKLNAALATESLPQAVFLKNSASLVMLRSAIRDGQFWEIGTMLDQYPNLKRLNREVLSNTAVDGKWYGLYQERPLSRQGVIYRQDWAERLGLQSPATVDKLYTMIKRFTLDDPDGNGMADTIGLTDRNDLIYGAFKTVSSYFGTPNEWGVNDGRLQPEFMFTEYMETMKFFRKLHQEQLMNVDFPVMGKVDQQQLFIDGKAGVYIGALGDVVSLYAKLKEQHPEASLDVENRVKGPKGYGIWSTPGYGSIVLFPKSAIPTEDRLREVLAFFDQLMEPEIANMIYWGMENEHYRVEEGKVIPSDDYARLSEEVRPYLALQIGGHSTIPGLLDVGYSWPTRVKAEQLVKDNDQQLIHDPTESLESVTYNNKGVMLQTIISDATYNFIIGEIDEAGFDSAIAEWKEQGGAKVIEEFSEAYRKQQDQ